MECTAQFYSHSFIPWYQINCRKKLSHYAVDDNKPKPVSRTQAPVESKNDTDTQVIQAKYQHFIYSITRERSKRYLR